MNTVCVKIIGINSCILSDIGKHKRSSPRIESLRSIDYEEKFDYTTLAFDVFMSDDKLVFSGPPAYGLEEFFNKENFYLNGQSICHIPEIHLLDRTQRNWLWGDNDVQQFKWKYEDVEFNISVNHHCHDLFRGKKVLFTLSKNNKFEWISDWIRFYKIIHDIDAVLFYDNNSDNYTLEELKKYLIEQNLGVDVVLVPWNFKYGPQGGMFADTKSAPWDSDFCQYGMMEHAKERFLKYSFGVINVDIDELIVGKNDESIFCQLNNIPAIHIHGKWIESVPLDKSAPVRFNNFFFYDRKNYKSDYKWCVSPQKIEYDAQWKVHTIKTKKIKITKNFYYLHYKAINYNWKIKRADPIDFDSKIHRLDESLYEIVSKVFPGINKPELKYNLTLREKLKKLF